MSLVTIETLVFGGTAMLRALDAAGVNVVVVVDVDACGAAPMVGALANAPRQIFFEPTLQQLI